MTYYLAEQNPLRIDLLHYQRNLMTLCSHIDCRSLLHRKINFPNQKLYLHQPCNVVDFVPNQNHHPVTLSSTHNISYFTFQKYRTRQFHNWTANIVHQNTEQALHQSHTRVLICSLDNNIQDYHKRINHRLRISIHKMSDYG